MEFLFEPVCDQLRAGSSYLHMSKMNGESFEIGRPVSNDWTTNHLS